MPLPPLAKRILIPWRTYVLLIVPLALLPFALSEEASTRCGYVVVVMIIFWITEALPLGVTSLLPAILFPILGIMTTTETCKHYLKDTNMMFIGGLMAAIAVEYSNLHYRIALKVVMIVGTTPMRLLIGLVVTAMFLSMWIVNSAATALMGPIVGAMVAELKSSRAATSKDTEAGKAKKEGEDEDRPDKETIGYYIAIAYGSNIGGIGTIIGTGTNLSFKGILDVTFPDSQLNFLNWMYFGVPYMLVATCVMTIFLLFFYMGMCRKKTPQQIANHENAGLVKEVIKERYASLGPMTFHEIMVMFWFSLLILLWVFRNPNIIPGWASLFYEDTKIKDATPVMLIIVILCMIPANLDFLDRNKPYEKPTTAVVNWPILQKNISWGLMLLLGGSFAMAQGMNTSQLSTKLGGVMSELGVLPPAVIMIITSSAVCVITQFSSNVCAANIALPVLAEMSTRFGRDPMYLMMPATVAASLAFMSPVSTPPNAITMAAGNLRAMDLLIAGIPVALLTLFVLFGMWLTVGVLVYGLEN